MDLQIAQFNSEYRLQDRRQNSVHVQMERRSGSDRRKASVFNKFKNDVDSLDNKTIKTGLNLLSPIPSFRRINSVPECFENKQPYKATGLMTLAALSFPADLKELGLGLGELKTGLKGNPYQHEISFFKNTLLNKVSNKLNILQKMDITFFDSKFGELLQRKFNLGVDFTDIGTVKDELTNNKLIGYKYTGNFAQKVAARALHRIPVIGLAIASAFEIPALIKSITQTEGTTEEKGKAFGKQFIKSTGYIGFTTAAIALAGAVTFPISSIVGLCGMAIGSVIGLKASSALNKVVDKL